MGRRESNSLLECVEKMCPASDGHTPPAGVGYRPQNTVGFDIQTDIRTLNLISIWISNFSGSTAIPLLVASRPNDAPHVAHVQMRLDVHDKRHTLAAQLVRSARERARVTQRELARRAGTTQAVIA